MGGEVGIQQRHLQGQHGNVIYTLLSSSLILQAYQQFSKDLPI